MGKEHRRGNKRKSIQVYDFNKENAGIDFSGSQRGSYTLRIIRIGYTMK